MSQNLIATYEFPWKVVNDANQNTVSDTDRFLPCQHDCFLFNLVILDYHCVPQTSGLGALLWPPAD